MRARFVRTSHYATRHTDVAAHLRSFVARWRPRKAWERLVGPTEGHSGNRGTVAGCQGLLGTHPVDVTAAGWDGELVAWFRPIRSRQQFHFMMYLCSASLQ